jgi:para-aminobenzoate synthetase
VRCLLIDHDDSFTLNLAHLLAIVNEEEPLVLPWREATPRTVCLLGPDQIVLSPGPGRPADFGLLDLLPHLDRPTLGVCLGHQAIAEAFGGTIARLATPMHGRIARVRHDGSALFRGLPPTFEAVRYHSLVVDRLPECLFATARSEDDAIMALAHRARPLWGVQFHPEAFFTPVGKRLLETFRDLAGPPRARATASRIRRPLEGAPPVTVVSRVHATKATDEQVFAALFGRSACAFWLDGTDRFTFMGESTTIVRSLDEVAPRLRPVISDLPFAFAGGWVGHITYEGDACFFEVQRFVAFDRETGAVHLVSTTDDAAWFENLTAKVGSLPDLPEPELHESLPAHRFARDLGTYRRDIERCFEHLRAGDSYELCLTNKVIVEGAVDAFAVHRALRRLSAAPYSAFFRTPEYAIVSSSPELFLSVRDGVVQSKPIKGTSARGATPAEDGRARAELQGSEKTRSENMMIIDLVRNDLSAVCEPGSVDVPESLFVETYASVHQLVSHVVGKLRAGCHPIEAIRAAFPGGSMTGAPKRRSMELLAAIEGAPRGAYSGALGVVGFDGSVELGMVIRAAVVEAQRVTLGVGGAIVALSEVDSEINEMVVKSQAVLRAIGAALVRSTGSPGSSSADHPTVGHDLPCGIRCAADGSPCSPSRARMARCFPLEPSSRTDTSF